MNVFDAVRTLLAVRRYQDRPVPEEVLHQVLEAGRLSPSARNKQPWRFVLVQDPETLRQLGSAAGTGPYVAEAPAAIVVAVEPSRFALSDASRAIQNILLTAWDAGVGGNWVGSGGEEAKAILGIPDELDVVAILPLGYPAEAIGQGKKSRKPLAEIAHRERWGEAFQADSG
jgi:nitroreductase